MAARTWVGGGHAPHLYFFVAPVFKTDSQRHVGGKDDNDNDNGSVVASVSNWEAQCFDNED
jgi:hypothetical protein